MSSAELQPKREKRKRTGKRHRRKTNYSDKCRLQRIINGEEPDYLSELIVNQKKFGQIICGNGNSSVVSHSETTGPSSSNSSSTSDIPGMYWDQKRRKYFKIASGTHLGPVGITSEQLRSEKAELERQSELENLALKTRQKAHRPADVKNRSFSRHTNIYRKLRTGNDLVRVLRDGQLGPNLTTHYSTERMISIMRTKAMVDEFPPKVYLRRHGAEEVVVNPSDSIISSSLAPEFDIFCNDLESAENGRSFVSSWQSIDGQCRYRSFFVDINGHGSRRKLEIRDRYLTLGSVCREAGWCIDPREEISLFFVEETPCRYSINVRSATDPAEYRDWSFEALDRGLADVTAIGHSPNERSIFYALSYPGLRVENKIVQKKRLGDSSSIFKLPKSHRRLIWLLDPSEDGRSLFCGMRAGPSYLADLRSTAGESTGYGLDGLLIGQSNTYWAKSLDAAPYHRILASYNGTTQLWDIRNCKSAVLNYYTSDEPLTQKLSMTIESGRQSTFYSVMPNDGSTSAFDVNSGLCLWSVPCPFPFKSYGYRCRHLPQIAYNRQWGGSDDFGLDGLLMIAHQYAIFLPKLR